MNIGEGLIERCLRGIHAFDKGIRAVSYKKVVHIFMGWIFTPLSACIVSLILIKIFEYFGFKIFI